MYKSLGWFCRTSVCLKTCFAFSCGYQWKFTLTIKTLQAIWTWRHAFWGSTSVFLLCHIGKVCGFFFHHWGLCFLGGHNYSLSRQNGGLIWGFPRWLKRCKVVVTSHCVSQGLLGSKKCVSFFFIFVQNMLTCALMRALLDSTSPVIYFQQISTTDHQSTPLF